MCNWWVCGKIIMFIRKTILIARLLFFYFLVSFLNLGRILYVNNLFQELLYFITAPTPQRQILLVIYSSILIVNWISHLSLSFSLVVSRINQPSLLMAQVLLRGLEFCFSTNDKQKRQSLGLNLAACPQKRKMQWFI